MDEKGLRDFLLTHSKINERFILDFFDIRTNYHANIHKHLL